MRAPWFLLLAACGGAQPVSAESPTAASASPAVDAAAPSSSAVAAAGASAAPTASAPVAAPPPSAGSGSVMIGEIAGTPKFDPKSTLEGAKDALLDCYAQARAGHPSLRGKVTLRIVVNEAGRVMNVETNPGGAANDPALVACIASALKANVAFQKPGGSATVVAPLVFHP